MKFFLWVRLPVTIHKAITYGCGLCHFALSLEHKIFGPQIFGLNISLVDDFYTCKINRKPLTWNLSEALLSVTCIAFYHQNLFQIGLSPSDLQFQNVTDPLHTACEVPDNQQVGQGRQLRQLG